MKKKLFTAIGLMSGTSMDGVDASIIQSDGVDQFSNILDEYCEFDEKLHKKLVDLRKSISTKADLKHFSVCLLYTSPSPRDRQKSRMPSSA